MRLSPLTKTNNSVIIDTLKVQDIISLYKDSFNINVEPYFYNIEEIFLYKDNDTGFSFFYPEIKADSLFYENFQKFDWYYMDWKWEFDVALSHIKGESNILEIGCGKGDFIRHLKKAGHNVVGLELNQDSVKKLKEDGIAIHCETVENFSIENENKFDWVICFQVLEHIYNVHDFISSAIKLLKPKGQLFISVPNNDSFMKYSYPFALNIPPHHLGMWGSDSLRSISKIFNVTTDKIIFENLQEYHFDWY